MEKEYLKEVDYYQIKIAKHITERYLEELRNNKSLTPEVAGYLLGMAFPVYKNILCIYCQKKIEKEKEIKPSRHDLIMMVPDAHKECHEKEEKEYQKGIAGSVRVNI